VPTAGERAVNDDCTTVDTVDTVDTVGAFMVGPQIMARGSPGGPLADCSFAVKDLFDVEGWPTGGGNPDWLAGSVPATATSTAARRLMASGATLIGKTHTDELAYSLSGTNVHYGTPINPNALGRIPGGSSSGSAAAVAAGLVDFALGTDTGGSIRVPASYCGVFGLRPSWGRVPVDGVLALAPSYDTVGVFARDASGLRSAAAALFGDERRGGAPVEGLVVADDAWALADPTAGTALRLALDGIGLPLEHVDLAGPSGGLPLWAHAFRILQGAEAWATHGEWISRRMPRFGPGIAARFATASRISPTDVREAGLVRRAAAERLRSLLDGRRVLVIPSTSGPAPLLGADLRLREDVRDRTLQMTCIAGHAGAPVVAVPLATHDGLPLGLSLIGTPGHDEQVLDLAVAVCAAGSRRPSEPRQQVVAET
jgi:amidase